MRSLRTQLSLIIMLVAVFTVAVISILSNLILNRAFEKYIAEQQQIKVQDIATSFHSQYNMLTQEWNVEYIHGAGMYALFDGYIIKLYDKDGRIVWDAENHDMDMSTQIMAEISERMEEKRPEIGGEFASHHYELTRNDQKIGAITVSYYGPYFLSESDFYFLDTLNLVLFVIGFVSLLLSLFVGGMLARRIANPITKTAYIAKQISAGNYTIRFASVSKTKELDELVSAINRLAEKLSEQEELRKRLAVNVAHDLRTPLTAVAAHLEAMIEGVWEPSAVRLQGCYEEIMRLSALVADLEQLSKTEDDHLVLCKTNVDLKEIACLASEQFAAQVQKKNLLLEVEGESSLVLADKGRVQQVVTNLLSNAVKFTPEGGKIRVITQDQEKSGVLVVEDNGIGIPEQDRPFVFERFYRTDESRNRKTGGAGIGLAIVASIVSAHGGTVEVESRTGGGSRFIVSFPK